MKRCPKIGDRVRYPGGAVVGACKGVVVRIYPSYTFDIDKSDRWNARHGKPLPESQWHVAMRPDALPAKWAYVGNDMFAPEVGKLEPAQ